MNSPARGHQVSWGRFDSGREMTDTHEKAMVRPIILYEIKKIKQAK